MEGFKTLLVGDVRDRWFLNKLSLWTYRHKLCLVRNIWLDLVLEERTHPGQALLQGVQDDELGEVEVLLRSFSKYSL